MPIQCDITSKESLAAAAEQVQKEAGFVNCVIANSGATGPDMYGLPKDRKPTLEEVHKYLWDTPTELFNQAFDVNTTACFYTFVAFLPLLDAGNKSDVAQKIGVKSQFIVTGSIAAFSRRPGMGFAYAGSKIAVSISPQTGRVRLGINKFQIVHIIKQLTTMLADWRFDIRANCFCPGVYPSDMSKVNFFHPNRKVNQ